MTTKFSTTYKIYINHTDAGGIVYHANHLIFLENCRRDWLASLGFDGYFPQGEHQNHQIKYPMKRDFYAKLISYIDTLKQQGREIMVMGDMNVAPSDNDVGIGSHVAKRWQDNGICSFLPEERLWYQALLDTDLTDTYRQHYPDTQEYSWFDYRSRGFDDNPKRGLRIDHILCTPALAKNCLSAGIDYTTRAQEKPSDHAPVWAKFDI